jgi:hypothetical protein
MTEKQLVVSADGHILEPTDLFTTRLPKHLRDRGVWEDDFEIEPLVEGGARIFRRLHTPGFEGWTISRYRQTGGRMPEGDPEIIIEDLDADGVDVGVMHPNLSLFGLYSDDHELSIAHARVYNDYVVERFSPYFSRWRRPPPSPSPTSTTRWPRSSGWPPAASGPSSCRRRRPSPTTPGTSTPCGRRPRPTVVHVFIHTQTGGVKVNDPEATTLKVVMENAAQVNQPVTEKSASKRMVTQAIYSTIVPQQVICELIGGGVPERYPTSTSPSSSSTPTGWPRWWAAWTSAGSPGSARTPTGGSASGTTALPAAEQSRMAQLFRLNEKWPYPLMPSEYVRSASSTSRSRTTPWPWPAGTSPGCPPSCGATTTRTPRARSAAAGSSWTSCSPACPADEKAAMVGGTLGDSWASRLPLRRS